MRSAPTWGAPHPERAERLTYITLVAASAEEVDEATEPDAQAAGDLPAVIADRYEPRGPLGRGGMGEVWRVWDRILRRHVALKIAAVGLTSEPLLARFEEEAQVAAQLQHPGIIPVHDLGRLPDGRLWFAMKEVEGETLEALLVEIHRAWRIGIPRREGLSFRRLLETFHRVCETVAYAHSRGVVHRDVKPSNIMVGSFGEVLVVDWGLKRVVAAHRDAPVAAPVDLGPGGGHVTHMSAIAGTPAYMSPEQAQGHSAYAGPAADVYALGATLYDLLCERPPRLAVRPSDLVADVARCTPIDPPSDVAESWVPVDEALDAICMRALADEPRDRYPDAGALAAELAAWLDGARKRARAEGLVEDAAELERSAAESIAAAHDLEARAAKALEGVAAADPSETKHVGWALEDEAETLRIGARERREQALQQLRSALSHAPDWSEVHERLAEVFHRRHAALEAEGRAEEARLVAHELAAHDRSGRFAAYLEGTGALTLVTDPPGAEVRLHRFTPVHRRLEPVFERVLGRTPLERVPLAMGSYLLTLHREGCEEVRYPVWIGRQEHWDGVPPGASEPAAIWLPPQGALAADECYVPAGWFWAGDDEWAHTLPLQRVWLDGFAIGRFPVTVGQYAAYLNAMDGERAEALQPRVGDGEQPLLGRDADGRFTCIRTDMGATWEHLPKGPDAPVVCVDWAQAEAYARAGGGRLPSQLEWQKAARGVDRRRYPWGEHFDPSWCRMASSGTPITFVAVGDYPLDQSPYGGRGMAANVCDWVADPRGDGRWVAGGSCASGPRTCGTTQRSPVNPHVTLARLGFRHARSMSPEKD